MSVVNTTPESELILATQTELSLLKDHEILKISNRSNELTIESAYHLSEIEQNKIITMTAKKIIWCGFIVICVGIIFALFGKVDVSIITTASGIITEVISAVVFAFVTQSNKSKLKYFKQLSLSDERDKYLAIIASMDKEGKETLLSQLINNFCEIRKTPD